MLLQTLPHGSCILGSQVLEKNMFCLPWAYLGCTEEGEA